MADKIDLEIVEIIRNPQVSPSGERRLAVGVGGLWVDAPIRRRPYYLCSAGVEHKRWWLLHQPGGGYPIVKKCAEHEVVERLSSQLRVI